MNNDGKPIKRLKLLTSSLWCSNKCLASHDTYNKNHDNFVEICPTSWKVTTNYHEAKKIVEMCQYFLNNNNNNNNLWFSLLNKEHAIENYILFWLLFQMKILSMHPNKLITHPLLHWHLLTQFWHNAKSQNAIALLWSMLNQGLLAHIWLFKTALNPKYELCWAFTLKSL
jgi:hypothetical protein